MTFLVPINSLGIHAYGRHIGKLKDKTAPTVLFISVLLSNYKRNPAICLLNQTS